MRVTLPTIEENTAPPDRLGAPPVAPTNDDPVIIAAADSIGGRLGRYARKHRGLTNVTRVLVLLTLAVTALGVAQRAPCVGNGWTRADVHHQYTEPYTHLCYSDIPHVFQTNGFLSHAVPYLHSQRLPYPVLVGGAARIAGLIATHLGGSVVDMTQWFYAVTVWLLLCFAALTVMALVGLAGRRPWDAALFALAPTLFLSGTINWDLLAVGMTTAALLAWSRERPVVAGLLLGFAEAVKFYPAMLLVALLVLCWRAGRMGAWFGALGGTILGWSLLNVPVILLARHGWTYYYTSNRDRSAGLGSLWTAIDDFANLSIPDVNLVVVITVGLAWLGVALLGLLSARRPRVAQLAFLAVAAFVLLDKVYSPQCALWLVPLAALARPRWRDFLIWQGCEVVYYVSVWLYLLGEIAPTRGMPENIYGIMILVHLAGTGYLVVQVIRDIIDPGRDVVRSDGVDDPAGGPLEGATDVYGFRPAKAERAAIARTVDAST